MMVRCNAIARIAAILLAAFALWAAPADAVAQCPCNYFTVQVDPAVNCPVAVCIQVSPLGPIACDTVLPGNSTRIPCPIYAFGLRLCDGSIHWLFYNSPLSAPSICSGILQLAPACCVRACYVGNDRAGCPVIEIQPAPCPGITC